MNNSANASAAGETVLPEVTVKATGNTESALGPVEGYVAKRSITATKTDTPLIETAQTVNVVTAEDMEIRNAQSLTDAFRYTAGINAMGGDGNTSSGDTMILRGFNIGSQPVYLNGAKLSRNTFSGVAEPYAMERMELLKGPASVLYGASAPGGLINMVNKLPQAEPFREMKLQLGSFDNKQFAGDFTGTLNESGTLSYRIMGLVRRSNTSVDHIPDDRDFGQISLRWQPSDRTSLTLLANAQHNKTAYNYGLPNEGTVDRNPNGRIDRDRFVGEPGFNKIDASNQTFSWLFSHRIIGSEMANRDDCAYHPVGRGLRRIQVQSPATSRNRRATRPLPSRLWFARPSE